MFPVSEAQDYDYMHRVKGADQIWSFRDDTFRIESQKDMKCVPFAVNICICEMHAHPHVHRTHFSHVT